MSKSKKKKKKKALNAAKAPQKKNNGKKITVIVAAAVIIVAVIIALIIFLPKNNTSAQLTEKTWTSQKAYTASGDEADLLEVYNVYYTAYQGSLAFDSDGTFELWLSPGDPDDGTHKGVYELKENAISVTLDSGEQADFELEFSPDGTVECIVVPYSNGYEDFSVYFYAD